MNRLPVAALLAVVISASSLQADDCQPLVLHVEGLSNDGPQQEQIMEVLDRIRATEDIVILSALCGERCSYSNDPDTVKNGVRTLIDALTMFNLVWHGLIEPLPGPNARFLGAVQAITNSCKTDVPPGVSLVFDDRLFPVLRSEDSYLKLILVTVHALCRLSFCRGFVQNENGCPKCQDTNRRVVNAFYAPEAKKAAKDLMGRWSARMDKSALGLLSP